MNKFKGELFVLIILLIVISVISIHFYNEMKEAGLDKVPIHWNVHNEPDNFATPLLACLIGPCVILLMMGITFSMSKREYSKIEKKSMRFVILLIAAFLVFMNWVALKSAVGYDSGQGFDVSTIHLGLGLLFILLGNQFGKLPYSKWVGIRVPATLNSEEVWNRVHQKSGKYMVISGLFVLSATVVGDKSWSIYFYLPFAVSVILMIFVFPTIEKKKVEKENKGA